MTEDPLVETWRIHDRIHRYLLEGIAEEDLDAALFPRGRTVRDLFAHVHNVRLMWLKSAAPELLKGQTKLEKAPPANRDTLSAALETSGAAIADLLAQSQASGERIKGFKPHTTAFAGYLIAHESHHRGQIEWALRHAGHALSDKVSFGLWEWGVR